MGQDQGEVGARVADEQKSPEEIRREIDETREELGDTAAAPAAKTDVKERAQERGAGGQQTITEKTQSLGSSPPSSGSGAGSNDPATRAGAAVSQAKTKAQENP